MRNLIFYVLPVRSHQTGERHVAVVDPQLKTLSEQRFREDHDRALTQVVRAGLEAESKQPDPFLAGVEHFIERALDLQPVAREDRLNDRQLDVELLRAILQRADVLRQTRSAERE